tara:strand:+ start:1233 stop:1793 length:561 start_codon:yes stop_codon:yes gene_type:complete
MGTDPNNPQGLFERIGKSRNETPSRREPIDCGHFDMRIGRDGTWYYRGSPIGRKPLVTLFSSVLTRDSDEQYWLETPVERGRIDVDDAPFTAVEMDVSGAGRDQRLIFRTNLDEMVTAGPAHPLRVAFDESTEEPSPYVLVRDRLEALLTRSVFYQLAELAEEDGETGLLGVWSGGEFFALVPSKE